MLGWEQVTVGTQLHAYDGHAPLPVCGLEAARRSYTDKMHRTIYAGPTPPPPGMVCQSCKTYEREHDPMYQEGLKCGREEAARVCDALASIEARNPTDSFDTGRLEGYERAAARIRSGTTGTMRECQGMRERTGR